VGSIRLFRLFRQLRILQPARRRRPEDAFLKSRTRQPAGGWICGDVQLKAKPKRELKDTWIECARYSSESCAIDILGLTDIEVSVIEDVEGLGTEFDIRGLREVCSFDQAEIKIEAARPTGRRQLQKPYIPGCRILEELLVGAPSARIN
jgi:hypothetical protein